MNIDDAEDELNRIAEKILALTEARKGEQKPYYVSALGIDLGEDLRLLKQLTNKGLNDFIQSRLSQRLTLIQLGLHRNVTAVVDGAADPDAFKQVPAVNQDSDGQRYNYRFWAAFSVPPRGEVRVLDSDDFTFEDMSQSDVPENALTIPPELIAEPGIENRNEKIKESIAKWLAKVGLPKDRFRAPVRLAKPSVVLKPAGSLLDAVIEALDRKQLQNTTLSLDVVAALLRIPRE